jgi:hypothetical protein
MRTLLAVFLALAFAWETQAVTVSGTITNSVGTAISCKINFAKIATTAGDGFVMPRIETYQCNTVAASGAFGIQLTAGLYYMTLFDGTLYRQHLITVGTADADFNALLSWTSGASTSGTVPVQYNRWTTNIDSTKIQGITLTNIPLQTITNAGVAAYSNATAFALAAHNQTLATITNAGSIAYSNTADFLWAAKATTNTAGDLTLQGNIAWQQFVATGNETGQRLWVFKAGDDEKFSFLRRNDANNGTLATLFTVTNDVWTFGVATEVGNSLTVATNINSTSGQFNGNGVGLTNVVAAYVSGALTNDTSGTATLANNVAVGATLNVANAAALTNLTLPFGDDGTNFWGVLNPTNLPAGLATSNYVGTFTGVELATNSINSTNFWGLLSTTNLPAAYVAPEATHATNADNATYATAALNSTNFWGSLSPTNLPVGLSTSNYVVTGWQISSNAESAWPTAPVTEGAAAFVNSNGVVFVLTSGFGATWTGTNQIAPAP